MLRRTGQKYELKKMRRTSNNSPAASHGCIDTAPEAPLFDPAGVAKTQNRAGSEIGAPPGQSSQGQCQAAPNLHRFARPEFLADDNLRLQQ